MNELNTIENKNPARNRGIELLRAVRFAFNAMAVGSQTIPLGDNRALVQSLKEHAERLYGGCHGRLDPNNG